MNKILDKNENVELEIKIPKKRGRKPKQINLENLGSEEVKVLKKRGRKPKNLNKPVEVKIPKKRGRKPILSKVTTTNKNISENFMTKDNVLHLKISSNDANNSILSESLYDYNPEINYPKPYEPNNFASKCLLNDNNINNDNDNNDLNENKNDNLQLDNKINANFVDTEKNIKLDNNEFENLNYNNILKSENFEKTNENLKFTDLDKKENIKNKTSSIMIYYNEYNKRKEWPKKSSINCFWCCHTFKGAPCCLPTKVKNDVFYVYGNFCSKECAAAYNFDSGDNSYNIWERYTLLNYLYSIIDNNPELKIKLAPPRMTLEMFGGNLSIEEFRESFETDKQYKVIYPPMISIIPSVDESNKNENMKKDTYYIPIDKERIRRVNNDLRLKRKNPINNRNTLENCMRLKYS
tara:strand:+ start:184 stop:1407 length:1224 start_codon:yes stop_codon:yes gene_type:complete